MVEVAHRIQCAWNKFGQNTRILMNRKISIKLRLKLFDAVVSPSLLFGLAVLPISEANINRIDACQRKMLRKIAGWIRYGNEQWETTMRRMNIRVQNALHQFRIKPWSQRLSMARAKYFERLHTLPNDRWEVLSMRWIPASVVDNSQQYHAFRNVGRPLFRWTDRSI